MLDFMVTEELNKLNRMNSVYMLMLKGKPIFALNTPLLCKNELKLKTYFNPVCTENRSDPLGYWHDWSSIWFVCG